MSLSQGLLHHLGREVVGEAFTAALPNHDQIPVVQPELVQDGGVQIESENVIVPSRIAWGGVE